MWDPLVKNNFVDFINKRIFIKLDTRFFRDNLRHGILLRVSDVNQDGDHTIILGYKSEYTHAIVSNIIDSIWYDNTLNNYLNNKLLNSYFEKNLNKDVFYEIKKFYENDLIYI